MPRVLAIVLNYRGAEQTMVCVQHLLSQRPVAPDILVIDNGSPDGGVDQLQGLPPQATLLALKSNLGFAGGMNAGLERALSGDYDYAWLLNNDAFATPDCLQRMLETFASRAGLGMLTPRLLSTDQSEQHAGGIVNWRDGTHTLKYSADFDVDLEVSQADGAWLTGTAPLVRMAAIRRIGSFDTAFFAYWEDVDLSVRMTRAGYSIGAVRTATALHLGSSSSGGRDTPFCQFMQTRNQWLFLSRHAAPRSTKAMWLRFVSGAIARSGLFEARGLPSVATAVAAGVSGARAGQYFEPPPRFVPRALERALSAAPWRVSRVLSWLADRLDSQASRDSEASAVGIGDAR